MLQSNLFNLTRWRFTAYYASAMGVILTICGIGYYQTIEQMRLQSLTQKIQALSGTLHDGFGTVLQKPGHLNSSAERLLPGLCRARVNCLGQSKTARRHVLGLVKQDNYYVQLRDLSSQVVATLGKTTDDSMVEKKGLEGLQIFANSSGERFIQYSLLLETVNHTNWGYIQVGRSLNELDQELAQTLRFLLWGWPLTMLFVSSAGWWLAGLSMRPVQQSYQNIQEFSANVAHELRTPLSAAKATVESVLELDNIHEEEARKTLSTIDRQINRLTQVVKDLMILSLMDADQSLLVSQKACQLALILNDVMDEFIALAASFGLSLSTDICCAQPILIQGDEEQLYRMIANIVMNAIHYTPPGGEVLIRLDCDKKNALIEVLDTGIGIPFDKQSQVFTRFYRVDSDRSRQTGGSGLGLSIAQAIAHHHKGKITVQSQPNQGSLFTIHLPLMPQRTDAM